MAMGFQHMQVFSPLHIDTHFFLNNDYLDFFNCFLTLFKFIYCASRVFSQTFVVCRCFSVFFSLSLVAHRVCFAKTPNSQPCRWFTLLFILDGGTVFYNYMKISSNIHVWVYINPFILFTHDTLIVSIQYIWIHVQIDLDYWLSFCDWMTVINWYISSSDTLILTNSKIFVMFPGYNLHLATRFT